MTSAPVRDPRFTEPRSLPDGKGISHVTQLSPEPPLVPRPQRGSTAFAILESIRLDLGFGSQVHP
jgi:hypothetical protein